MDDVNNEIVKHLIEIENLLSKIYICFEDEYKEKLSEKFKGKKELFDSLLTDARKKIYVLLFSKENYSQTDIATMVGTSPSTVSKFIKALLENQLIIERDVNGIVEYQDIYDFVSLLD